MYSSGHAAISPLGVVVLHADTRDGAASANAVITCLDGALSRLSSNASLVDGSCFTFRETANAEADAHTGEFIDHLKELRTRVLRGPFGRA